MTEFEGPEESREDVSLDIVNAKWNELTDDQKQDLINRYAAARQGESTPEQSAAQDRNVVELEWASLSDAEKDAAIRNFYDSRDEPGE